MTIEAVRTDLHSLLSARGTDRQLAGGFGPAPTGLAENTVRLLGGVPADEALPTTELADAFAGALKSPAALHYSVLPGIAPLREWIGAREGVDPDRILVTNGALHALNLIFDAILEPGDVVAVESPTFPLALREASYYGATFLPVQTSENGLDLDGFEEQLRAGARPKLFYVIPDFQNPTGSTLSAQARTRLVALAEQYGFLIVSDNPYKELRFGGTAVDDFDLGSDNVIRANTFSKTLGPGLRLGWIASPEWLLPALSRIRSTQDQHTSLVTQTAVANLLHSDGTFDRIVAGGRDLYRERSSVLVDTLESALPGQLRIVRPEGGIFLWLTAADPDVDLADVQTRARALGVDFSLGRYFDPTGPVGYLGSARLGFSNQSVENLVTGANRFAEAFRA
ncbi:PLP-dependent aminotransferase family protein [Rhodococcus sp. Eu-32]|uniref:aminotransferase-like domain-containing protein n=1 Tax=Rhodococcus sp. Eu-32 TaxID=1017319 RepID=UPI000DF44DE8|nr:PLP-dependent aminotransferase family protein [Rhodococcus sp. Eu-32]RRQ29443.1 PLP-dependent aminotransferase family protein [Rhodococcus sp. Eu-32]